MKVSSQIVGRDLQPGKYPFKINGVRKIVRIYNEVKKGDKLLIEEKEPISPDGVKWYQQYVEIVQVEEIQLMDIDESNDLINDILFN